jgi:transcriptional regulator with XRE-family HTH domain
MTIGSSYTRPRSRVPDEEIQRYLYAGAWLREWRDRRHMSVRQVAEIAGVDRVTVWRAERGEHILTDDSLRGVAGALGMPQEAIVEYLQRVGYGGAVFLRTSAADDLADDVSDLVSILRTAGMAYDTAREAPDFEHVDRSLAGLLTATAGRVNPSHRSIRAKTLATVGTIYRDRDELDLASSYYQAAGKGWPGRGPGYDYVQAVGFDADLEGLRGESNVAERQDDLYTALEKNDVAHQLALVRMPRPTRFLELLDRDALAIRARMGNFADSDRVGRELEAAAETRRDRVGLAYVRRAEGEVLALQGRVTLAERKLQDACAGIDLLALPVSNAMRIATSLLRFYHEHEAWTDFAQRYSAAQALARTDTRGVEIRRLERAFDLGRIPLGIRYRVLKTDP